MICGAKCGNVRYELTVAGNLEVCTSQMEVNEND
jgi:hypothetical protein